jgi:signal transduction histidine kinase
VVLGILSAHSRYARERTAEDRELTRNLSDSGEQLERIALDLQSIAIEQAQAIRGLFEASTEVTREEFDHFTSVIGMSISNRLGYAERVPAQHMDQFVANAVAEEPAFALHGESGEATGIHYPLLFSSETDVVGFSYGFDFGSVPEIRAAIERSFATNGPVAAPVKVPGDDEPGDFLIISPIFKDGAPIGVATVTLRLDELLAPRVDQLVGPQANFELGYTGEPVENSIDRWGGSLHVIGIPVGMLLEVDNVQSGERARWALALGVIISLFLGWVIRAVSRRRALTREIRALQETLSEKDRFLAGVSHELRTPLTVVVGSLEVLSDQKTTLEPEVREMLLEDARLGAVDLETLVEDYLTAARLTTGAIVFKRESFSLDLLVARVLATAMVPEKLKVKVGSLGRWEGDPLRLRQILRNLVNNAKRYAVSQIEIRLAGDSDRPIVEILNDGDPIPTEIASSMFDPFAKGRSPGQPEKVGLGLSVSRELARRMGGDLTYSYADGKVCFRLLLPASNSSAVREQVGSPTATAR